MKFIVLFACLLATTLAAEDTMLSSSYGASAGYGQPAAAPAAPAYSAPAPVSIPAPPCPKNYLFSCQPNLQPVPCSAPAPSYGSAGAYSQYAPVYAPLQRPLRW
ncbi:vitelline membrane protein Vm34Ca [Drosophila busckii]|uniref:vitelline membrane protein Vm34Ca n=1 Tax=Drosophila busckii TaxID=30019 RepID=UPI00083EE17D|nr:vitelline membrane protein Vm34Ca [Drosophila busckii]